MMRIKRFFGNVHMGLGHDGLAKLCKEEHSLDLSKLRGDELVLFVNKRMDKVKVIGHKGLVLGYLRTPGGQKLMMDALQWLPQTFGAHGFNYDAAVEKALRQRFGVEATSPKKQASPLETARAKDAAGV